MKLLRTIAAAAFLLSTLGSASRPAAADALSVDEMKTIAEEAYIYFYPLVTMDVSRRQFTNIEAGKMIGRGPANTFSNIPAFPTAEFRGVVRPNFDTLYSSGWLDLTGGPVVLSVPDTAGRYYMMPMLDMWTDVFAVPGKRTTGTGAGDFAVVPPGWKGKLPKGVQRIDAPTPYVWVIGRTQTNGPQDYDPVHQLQAAYKLTPLADWGKKPRAITVKIDPSVDMKTPPLNQVNDMPARQYFAYATKLMKLHPPHITDQPIVARMQRIGLVAGKYFDFDKADPAMQQALKEGAADGLKKMQALAPTLGRAVNGWRVNTDTMGVYGTYYLKRAVIAMVGLGANLPEDAVYPLNIGDSDGKPLTGEHKYLLHFDKGETPPNQAFWSVTMYDAEGFQVANSLNRFAIGDRDALKYNLDGSLDLCIQHDSPGADRESNWLPSPASGTLGVTMRIYAPADSVLDGSWVPPAVKRVD